MALLLLLLAACGSGGETATSGDGAEGAPAEDAPAEEAPADRPNVLADLRIGWSEFSSRTWLWVVVAGFCVLNAAWGGSLFVLGPVVADDTIGRQSWGLVLAAQTGGMLIGALIAMRLRVHANSLTGARATNMIIGAVSGLLLAIGTIVLAATDLAPAAVRTDLLAVLLACWMFGWILGPLYTGGSDAGLRPEQFALLPLKPLRLAFGLLTAGFVGIAPVVSLIAFTALVIHAGGRGPAAIAVSVPAALLQLVLVVDPACTCVEKSAPQPVTLQPLTDATEALA